jgi:hypothetical protein
VLQLRFRSCGATGLDLRHVEEGMWLSPWERKRELKGVAGQDPCGVLEIT